MSGVRIEEITDDDDLLNNNQEPNKPSDNNNNKRKHSEPIIEEPDEPSKKKSKKSEKVNSKNKSLSKHNKKHSKNPFMSSMFGDFFGSENDFFSNPFGNFFSFEDSDDDDDDVNGNFFNMQFDDFNNENANGTYQCFSSSSSSTITYDKNGNPHIREKTSSSKSLNGNVEEKTNTLRDSDLGIEKINLERRIGAKSKKIEKVRVNGGAIESSESVKGMTQEEARKFEDDWEKATVKPKGLLKNKKSKNVKLIKDSK